MFWFIITSLGLGAIVLTRFGTQAYASRAAAPPPTPPQPPFVQLPSPTANDQAVVPAAPAAGAAAEPLPPDFLSDLEDDLRAAKEDEPPAA